MAEDDLRRTAVQADHQGLHKALPARAAESRVTRRTISPKYSRSNSRSGIRLRSHMSVVARRPTV
jgi:hypothetical protein